jgi:hypothetical protein
MKNYSKERIIEIEKVKLMLSKPITPLRRIEESVLRIYLNSIEGKN